MTKKIIIIVAAMIFAQWAAFGLTWTATQSGTVSESDGIYTTITFPYAGTANISFSLSTPYPTVGAGFSGTGQAGAYHSPSAGPFSFTNLQVFPQVYTMEVFCVEGSGTCTINYTLTYTLNRKPVISSITASPNTGVYGTPITVTVSATDQDNNLSYVRFVNGSISYDDNTSPYTHAYDGLSVGNYTVTGYAVDTQAESDDESVQFTITQRPITVAAKGGSSTYGTMPTGQGLELVSGTLVYGDSLSGLGLTTDSTIYSSTPAGTYTINVLGSPSNYSVSRTSGTWTVINAINGCIDWDNDGIPDCIENALYGNLTTLSSINQIKGNTDGDLYSRLIELLGGRTEGSYTSGSWMIANAPGNALVSGVMLITSEGACFSVNTSTLTLNPIN